KATEGAQDPFAHNNLGRAYEGVGNMTNASKHYALASDMRTDNKMFAKNAGVTFNRLGNDQMTVKYLERALANGDGSAEVLVNLANAHSRTGNTARASELMAKSAVEETFSNNPDYWFN